ncbi:hypothetical protein QBC40DRAFT_283481, partial [Triangularia verruculosa]
MTRLFIFDLTIRLSIFALTAGLSAVVELDVRTRTGLKKEVGGFDSHRQHITAVGGRSVFFFSIFDTQENKKVEGY